MMKRISIVVAILIVAGASVAGAEEKKLALEPGAWAIEFGIANDFQVRAFNGMTLSLRKNISDRAALRFGTRTDFNTDRAAGECLADHPDEAGLYGRWSWIQTMDFLSGYLTPESEGYTMDLVLASDGSYSQYLDGAKLHEGNWCLKVCDSGSDPEFCAGQTILQLSDSCVPGSGACQLDYWFCPDSHCATTTVPFERAIQLQPFAMDAGIQTYEYVGPIPVDRDSWSALKARF